MINKGRTEVTIFTLHPRNYGSELQLFAKITQLSEAELYPRFSKLLIFIELRWTLIFLLLQTSKRFSYSCASITSYHIT